MDSLLSNSTQIPCRTWLKLLMFCQGLGSLQLIQAKANSKGSKLALIRGISARVKANTNGSQSLQLLRSSRYSCYYAMETESTKHGHPNSVLSMVVGRDSWMPRCNAYTYHQSICIAIWERSSGCIFYFLTINSKSLLSRI